MLPPAIRIIDSFPSPTAGDYTEERWHRQHQDNIVVINSFSKEIWFPEHWSPLSVKCAFGGSEFYHFGKATLSAGDKNFLVVNEGAVYESSIRSERPVESFTINFTRQNVQDVYGSMRIAGKQLDNPFERSFGTLRFAEKMYPHQDGITPVLLKIRGMVRDKETDQRSYLELCYALLEEMVVLQKLTLRETENVRAIKQSTREEMYKRLTLARDHMESCFAEEITLHDLSRICYLNPCYLLRSFKQYYGLTPHRYLTCRRLQEAMRLLMGTAMPICDLAKAVGFQDPGSFSKLFKKHYGLSPERFRTKRL